MVQRSHISPTVFHLVYQCHDHFFKFQFFFVFPSTLLENTGQKSGHFHTIQNVSARSSLMGAHRSPFTARTILPRVYTTFIFQNKKIVDALVTSDLHWV